MRRPTGGLTSNDLIHRIHRMIETHLATLAPQRMIVQSVDTDGLVSLLPVEPGPDDEEAEYAQVYGWHLEPDDEVWVTFGVGTVGMVIGLIRRTASGRREFDYPVDIRTRDGDSTAALRVRDAAGVTAFEVDTVDLQVVAPSYNSPKFAARSQNSADSASTSSTSVYADAMTTSIILPTGTWHVYTNGDIFMRHSTAAAVDVRSNIAGTGQTEVTQSVVSSGFDRVGYSGELAGVAGGTTVSVKTQFKANVAGTATADQPKAFVAAVRTS